jgi:hypothetical protein
MCLCHLPTPLGVQVWQRHPDQLVGWFPRLAATTPDGDGRYLSKLLTLLWQGRYSIILTKGAIMHARYLEAYSKAMPAHIRRMVTEQRNCEDIAMQFVVSNITGDAPYFVWDPTCEPSSAVSFFFSEHTFECFPPRLECPEPSTQHMHACSGRCQISARLCLLDNAPGNRRSTLGQLDSALTYGVRRTTVDFPCFVLLLPQLATTISPYRICYPQ